MERSSSGKSKPLKGEIKVPGDKSITHRAIILGSIAHGETRVTGFLAAEDCLRTIVAFQSLGVEITREKMNLGILGGGFHGLKESEDAIDLGNSGTGIRLLAGVLAGQEFFSILTGDNSLRQRPMRRVVELGDGWSPMTGELADLKNDVAKLKEMVRAAGRDPEQMDFAYRFAVGGDDPDRERSRQHVVKANYVPTKNATTPEEIIEAIGVHREAGFNHLCIDFTWSTPAELMRHMESFAAKVMPKVTVSS